MSPTSYQTAPPRRLIITTRCVIVKLAHPWILANSATAHPSPNMPTESDVEAFDRTLTACVFEPVATDGQRVLGLSQSRHRTQHPLENSPGCSILLLSS